MFAHANGTVTSRSYSYANIPFYSTTIFYGHVGRKQPNHWLKEGLTGSSAGVKRTNWDESSLVHTESCRQTRLAFCQPAAADFLGRNSGHPRRPHSPLLWPWWTPTEPAQGIWSGLCKNIWRHLPLLLTPLPLLHIWRVIQHGGAGIYTGWYTYQSPFI